MKTILYNPIFINPQAYYVFPRLTRWLRPDDSYKEPANYIGQIEVTIIAYGEIGYTEYFEHTNYIDFTNFSNSYVRISLFTRLGSCVLGEWKIGAMEGDRPYIEPEVLASLKAVVIVGDKTNQDKDRDIVANLVDASNPFIISNAAYKLNSGYGKYEVDFTTWSKRNVVTSNNDNSFSFESKVSSSLLYYSTTIGVDTPSFKIKANISNCLVYYYYINDKGTLSSISILESGEFELPISHNTLYNGNIGIGFEIGRINGTGTGTITQIPSYQGAFVTDGVDDLITSTKTVQEMGITDEITVVSMIGQLSTPNVNNYTNTIRNQLGTTGSYNKVSAIDKTGIYGYSFDSSLKCSIINDILGDKQDYSVSAATQVENIGAKYLVQGWIDINGLARELSSVAWYWTIIANKVLTTDQINQVIAYFNLDRTLNPDILCDIEKQGITNENHAEFGDKLIDFSGNGRDIQLNNIAWKGDSGIGKYEVDFLDSSIWNSSNSTITSSKIDCKNAISHIMLLYYSVGSKEYPDIPSFKVIKTGADIDYSYIDETGSPKSVRIVDGVNVLPASHNTLYSGSGRFCGFGNPGMGNSVTITQIPSHAGGLCLDGVNDFGKVTGMPIYKDYTFIIDYERISYTSPEVWTASVVSKAHTVGQGAFILMLANREVELSRQSNSFGSTTTFNRDDFTRTLLYQSKYKCGDVNLTIGEGIDGDTLWLGTLRDNDYRFFNGAIYSLMSFPYSMSEFLIERQLKKHKLGTLYPDMVEFRPVIKSNVLLDAKPTFVIRGTSTYLNAGDYVPENSQIWVSIKMNNIADRITKFTVNGKTIDIPENAYSEVTLQYGFPFVIDKSPQKISITIEQDENYVLFNPTINSNAIFEVGNEQNMTELIAKVRNHEIDGFIMYLSKLESKYILPNSWINKDTEVISSIYCLDNILQDDLHINIDGNSKYCLYADSSNNISEFLIMDDNVFEEQYITNVLTANTIDIQLDQYIRYEDIVQPYPVLLRFNDENGNEVSWGGKFRVGSTITRIGSIDDTESNLLNGLYSISGLSLNGKAVTSSTSIVEKQMVFKTTATYLLDDNEPKCILSPRLLRIPNSSYKILGHIPDISGHGNNGVIHNSAYAEGSGVNEDGSYQFDGVDDFVAIPTLSSGGKQVLMKVNQSNVDSCLYTQVSAGIGQDRMTTSLPTSLAYQGRWEITNWDKVYIDGIENNHITNEQLYDITHIITAISRSSVETVSPIIGALRVDNAFATFAQMALYDFMLFDEISTDEKILELNEYVGIEAKVELPPYYWDAYGKTNSDADKDTIQQRGIAVGDYDLTNTNFAYDKMSGFGGYTLGKFTNSWSLSNNSNSISIVARNPYDITLKKLGENRDWEFKTTELKIISNPVSVKFKSDKNIRLTCDYHYYTVGGNSEGAPLGITSKDLIANEDTIITISPISQENIDKYNIDINRGYYLIYFQLSLTLAVNEEVTIEMLPLYPNGLVYDGVEDFSDNKNVPLIDDFTVIAKRT